MSSDVWIEGKGDTVLGVTMRAHGPVEFTIFEERTVCESDGAELGHHEPLGRWWVTAPSRGDRYTLFQMGRVAAEYVNASPDDPEPIEVPEWNEGEVEETTHSAIVGRDENGEVYLHTLNLFGRDDGTMQMILADSGLLFRILEQPVDADNPDGVIQIDDPDELRQLVGIIEHELDTHEGEDWSEGETYRAGPSSDDSEEG